MSQSWYVRPGAFAGRSYATNVHLFAGWSQNMRANGFRTPAAAALMTFTPGPVSASIVACCSAILELRTWYAESASASRRASLVSSRATPVYQPPSHPSTSAAASNA